MTVRCFTLGALETNCYLVWDDPQQALVIDPADNPDAILAALTAEGLQVSAVVLTHVHFDHMLAAAAVQQATGAPLWVGAGDAAALTDSQRNLSAYFTPGRPLTLQADRLLREGDVLSVGGCGFTVWETPGHTPGCICLVGDEAVFSGDTLFCGSIGRTDFPGGDIPAMRSSLERLAALPPQLTVYAGHGPATTIGQEIQTNPYLR